MSMQNEVHVNHKHCTKNIFKQETQIHEPISIQKRLLYELQMEFRTYKVCDYSTCNVWGLSISLESNNIHFSKTLTGSKIFSVQRCEEYLAGKFIFFGVISKSWSKLRPRFPFLAAYDTCWMFPQIYGRSLHVSVKAVFLSMGKIIKNVVNEFVWYEVVEYNNFLKYINSLTFLQFFVSFLTLSWWNTYHHLAHQWLKLGRLYVVIFASLVMFYIRIYIYIWNTLFTVQYMCIA